MTITNVVFQMNDEDRPKVFHVPNMYFREVYVDKNYDGMLSKDKVNHMMMNLSTDGNGLFTQKSMTTVDNSMTFEVF